MFICRIPTIPQCLRIVAGVAICDDERCCPVCGRLVIGYDAVSNGERRMIRWRYAYRNKESLR